MVSVRIKSWKKTCTRLNSCSHSYCKNFIIEYKTYKINCGETVFINTFFIENGILKLEEKHKLISYVIKFFLFGLPRRKEKILSISLILHTPMIVSALTASNIILQSLSSFMLLSLPMIYAIRKIHEIYIIIFHMIKL